LLRLRLCISAESGIPTFRDSLTGLWSQYSPEELATPEAFRSTPKLVWEWYEWRRSVVRQSKPNAGHIALADLERRVPRFQLVTQNVDGLHRQAGSKNVIELHGNILDTKCLQEDVLIADWDDGAGTLVPPICKRCRGPARPAVVWFGEALPPGALDAADTFMRTSDMYFSIGTSSLVYPASLLPETAGLLGITLVEVNTQRTHLSRLATYFLEGRAGVVLPQLMRAAFGAQP
jgi:NAD-dependent deacetylase